MAKKNKSEKWYDKVTTRLWDEFQIEIPLLSSSILDGIEDDLDLEMLIEELHDQKEMGESYDLYDAVKSVVMSQRDISDDEYDYIYG